MIKHEKPYTTEITARAGAPERAAPGRHGLRYGGLYETEHGDGQQDTEKDDDISELQRSIDYCILLMD